MEATLSVKDLQAALSEAEAKMALQAMQLEAVGRNKDKGDTRIRGRHVLKMALDEAAATHELLSHAQRTLSEAVRKKRPHKRHPRRSVQDEAAVLGPGRVLDPGRVRNLGKPPKRVANACYSGSEEDARLGRRMLENHKKYIQCPGIEERSWGLYRDVMKRNPMEREVPLVTVGHGYCGLDLDCL